jgi:hypothetical protein
MTMPTTASTTASNTARTAATIDVQASAKRDILIRPRSDADDVYPSIDDMAGLRAYFEREGFVVLRRALPPLACETARQAFLREALPARRAYFKRHASGRYERNVYTEHGHMKFPIMNLQDIGGRRFRQFRQRGLELLTHDHVQHIMRGMFGEPGRLVHTMYFDGNQATWAHRDGDYFDSAASGRMIGVWIAAEDIHPDAGRFYVVPRSHCSAIPGIDNPKRRRLQGQDCGVRAQRSARLRGAADAAGRRHPVVGDDSARQPADRRSAPDAALIHRPITCRIRSPASAT